MKVTLLILGMFLCSGFVFSQKGSAYFYWGYNRASFSPSNIYFRGPDFSFTVYDAAAHDRPTKFGAVYFKPSTISIPQNVYRAGYFVTNRLHLSIGNDHMKYVVDPDQEVVFSGNIAPTASEKYAGNYLSDTIGLTDDFLRFEHTNGLNSVSLDLEYLLPIAKLWNGKVKIGWNNGLGGIWIVTRTDSRIFESQFNNDFHVSGFAFHGKMGPRIDLGKHLFCMLEVRGGFVSLPWIQLRNEAPYSAEQNFFFLERYAALGIKHQFKRKKH
jgi:hypothetical protein